VDSQLADANIVPKNSGAEWLRPFFRLRAICFWLLPCLLLPPQDVAKSDPPDKEVTLDQTASRIDFSLAATLHTVNGTFDLKEGFIRIDPESGKLTGRIVVDVQSGKTGDPERDRRMHQEILESGRFPEAVFLPDRIIDRLALAGESIIGVHGVLRLHGEDHDMTLPVKVSIENGPALLHVAFLDPVCSMGHEGSEHDASPRKEGGSGADAHRGRYSLAVPANVVP
jgi:polyisoprenoid-binding protein YceI